MRMVCGLLFLIAAGVQAVPFRGVNLSGWFQSPDVRQLPLSRFGDADFENLRALGVDAVRLPVNFAAYAGPGPEFRLDPRLLSPLDQAVDGLLAHGLTVILDNHSDWDASRFQPDRSAFLSALWSQLAQRYRDRGPRLIYEIQNEPHDIGPAAWDGLQRRVLDVIRRFDGRTVVVTGADWGSAKGLLALKRFNDDRLLYSFHFYDPFRFTHQGADWAGQADLKGVRFTSNDETELRQTLDAVADFAGSRGVPVFCGEFGVYNKVADAGDRVVWYRTVRKLLEERGLAWTMWDYKGSFGLFKKDSAEIFEQDVDLELTAALGLRRVPQSAPAVRKETESLALYRDGWTPGTREAVWAPSGTVDFADTRAPRAGRASLLVADVSRYSSVAWDFAPWKDLSALKAGRLVFWARSGARVFSVDLRLVDGSGPGPDGLPWRLAFTLDQNILPGDGAWHRVEVPLPSLRDAGAWDGTWHDPRGAFAWNRVARFEIAAEPSDLRGELGFDEIVIEIGSQQQER